MTRRYRCPKCGTTITLHITPTEPPICNHNRRYGNNRATQMLAEDDTLR